METEKSCSVCGEVKQLTEFYTIKKVNNEGEQWTYYRPDCKECTKKKAIDWGKDNREAQKDHNVKYKKTKRAKEKRKTVWMKNYRESGKRKEWEENNRDKLYEYCKQRGMNKKHNINKEEWENCKNYFNYRCAYCGLKIEEHYIIFKGENRLGDFHKEHVDHSGNNDLSNCVPACKTCNVQKNTYSLDEWFNINDDFTYEHLEKINNWLQGDYEKYIKRNKNI